MGDRTKIGAAQGHEEVGSHGGKPWVYFMVDLFMLIVQFLIISFKFKAEEVVLPQTMPPGGTRPPQSIAPETLSVYVTREHSVPMYEILHQRCTFPEFSSRLASTASSGKELTVRVAYERLVPFEDVMQVFNECAKVQVKKVGLAPLRGEPAETR